MSLDFDLRSPEFLENPYPTYARMREQAPVWLEPFTGHVYVSRYADIKMLLLSDEFSSNRVEDRLSRVPAQLPSACLATVLHDRLMMTDGEEHRVMRRRFSGAFTAAMARTYAERINEIVAEAFADIDWQTEVDLLNEVAIPIPSRVILEVLGFPPGDHADLRAWTDDFYRWLAHSPDPIEIRTERALHGTGHMYSYILDRVNFAREAPSGSLLCQLVNNVDALQLTNDQVVANLIGIVNAAHETTTSLIVNGTLLLLRNPDQLQRLLDNPSLISQAVDEMLRIESPAQIVSRVPIVDLELEGVTIEAGQLVAALLGAGNHDPEVYSNPDEFVIDREGPAHLSFGHGAHFCVGAALAKIEAVEIFTAMLPMLPRMRILTDPIPWRGTPAFRCPSEFIVTCREEV